MGGGKHVAPAEGEVVGSGMSTGSFIERRCHGRPDVLRSSYRNLHVASATSLTWDAPHHVRCRRSQRMVGNGE
ncbi:hypothetical protein B296_00014871 [Ensete ventricosum]|uniref:Uncharacterized protein n=1 Tax=Ensete ventricosum TaxID=4639 RepID=A0A427AXS1_ENSVE|nr:hypothetical protein B296_00014871 [Ensete ventricosum]